MEKEEEREDDEDDEYLESNLGQKVPVQETQQKRSRIEKYYIVY